MFQSLADVLSLDVNNVYGISKRQTCDQIVISYIYKKYYIITQSYISIILFIIMLSEQLMLLHKIFQLYRKYTRVLNQARSNNYVQGFCDATYYVPDTQFFWRQQWTCKNYLLPSGIDDRIPPALTIAMETCAHSPALFGVKF